MRSIASSWSLQGAQAEEGRSAGSPIIVLEGEVTSHRVGLLCSSTARGQGTSCLLAYSIMCFFRNRLAL